ncbi:hypothetical protein BGZ58_009192 [Dissophora ornata]|nr:hypothetical protein BGZ58_009192 [Dissophora ornata]
MLTALVGLRILKLDLPLEDFTEEEDQTIHSTAGISKESALIKAIETCASARLEHLELVFQTSIRIPVEALCSLLRTHPSLHTVKLMDADIVDSRPRVPSKKTKHKRKENIENRALSSLSVSGSSSIALSVPNSASEDEPESPIQLADSFGLRFLSITSSHTSDIILRRILESCPNITALHFHSCDMITDSVLEDIVRLLPRLSSISLSSCKQFTSAGIDKFFLTHPQPLVHVHICALAGLHDGTLEILARHHGPALRKLAIYYCAFVSNKGIKALLMACSKLQVFGLQAYGMTPAIFEEPWACHQTLTQLDLQGVFKSAIENGAAGSGDGTGVDNVSMSDFSATRVWRDRQARIEAFGATRLRLMTLSSLRNLRLSAGGIGKEVLEGFGLHQRIEALHLYGLQSTDVDKLPWTAIREHYPFLKQVYCGVNGVMTKGIKDDLAQLNIELLTSSSIPDLAFENNFDDCATSLW